MKLETLSTNRRKHTTRGVQERAARGRFGGGLDGEEEGLEGVMMFVRVMVVLVLVLVLVVE